MRFVSDTIFKSFLGSSQCIYCAVCSKLYARVPFWTVSFSFPLAGVVVINEVTYFTIRAGIWFESLFPVSRHRLIGLMPAGGGIMGSFKCLRWARILIYRAHVFNIERLYLHCHFNEASIPREMLLIIISVRGRICLHDMHTHRLIQVSQEFCF